MLCACRSSDAHQASQFQDDSQDFDIFGELFHVPDAFKIDYLEMERTFKIFVYPHNTSLCDKPRKLDGEYGNEGLFFENLKRSRFLTKDPDKAHLFLIPISCHSFPAEGRSEDERAIAVEDFVKSLISKYPYWNRTLGADHFFVSCADIDVTVTARIVNLVKNSIRVMCSPTYNLEYVPHKDVSLPQSVQPFNDSSAGNKTRERSTLAFWRGLTDSDTREKLVDDWVNCCPQLIDINIGPQLDGAIAVAINYGCVPVILSDHYDLPFKDILDWKKFSVQKHFEWNLTPVRLDAFHMVMYELWLRHHVTKYC
ncbi:unnamed protein product [Dovyalis caffra]|uniref:Exostosin GT47 domain-containing protein n=1 Tax=Dovyalis caffra TaxID=77055 RepID=A0AAV1SR72_9ROSI|nr:unnamed protein product [Dovyalis caffra]